jgi:raffinose/stachyose/melibiose transport system permease protein
VNRKGRNVVILPFLAPAIILYTAFFIYPTLQSFYLSMTDWAGYTTNYHFIGLANFLEIARDGDFYNALKNNVVMLVFGGVGTLGLALAFAVLLWQKTVKGEGFFRTLLFSPSVVSSVAIAVAWTFVLSPRIGLLNSFLRNVGLSALAKPWLGEYSLVLPILITIGIWGGVGYYMVLFLAGLSRLPTELFDAAKVDGADQIAMFFRITMPLMWDMVVTLLGLFVIGSLRTFDLIWIMTGGGPAYNSETMAVYMYRMAMGAVRFSTEKRMGFGVAVAVVMFGIILIVTFISQRLSRKEALEF